MPVFQNHVHFMAGIVPPEIRVGEPAGVESAFQVFRYHKRLEYASAQIMPGQLAAGTNVQQRREEARVVKVEFWLFDDALVEVAVVRLQQKNDETGLQHRHPGTDGLVIDADITADARQIQKLSDAAGATFEKPLKCALIPDILDRK